MNYKLLILITISSLICVNINAAGIQKWEDKNGKTYYGVQPPEGLKSTDVKGNVSAVSSSPAAVNKAILYSTSWCGFCKKARRFLQTNKIDFVEYDIEKDSLASAKFKQSGGQGVPFLVLGEQTIRGFTDQGYQRFFGINSSTN